MRDLPIIALTASAIKGDRERCEEAGMSDYLAKPFNSGDLEKALARWVGKRRSERKKGAGVERFSDIGSREGRIMTREA